MSSLLELIVKPGDDVTAARWNQLVRWVDKLTPLRTAGALRRELPTGVITSYRGKGGKKSGSGMAKHPFKVQLIPGQKVGVRIARGLIGGVEASLNGKPFMRPDSKGIFPTYEIPEDAWITIGGEWQQALLYLREELTPAFVLSVITPEARSTPPKRDDLKSWKLVAFLLRKGKDGAPECEQMLYFNQGFAASERRGRRFRPWHWAT